MNGIFTRRHDLAMDEMTRYVRQLCVRMFGICRVGMAFNFMSQYVDYHDEALYYPNLADVADFVGGHLSSTLCCAMTTVFTNARVTSIVILWLRPKCKQCRYDPTGFNHLRHGGTGGSRGILFRSRWPPRNRVTADSEHIPRSTFLGRPVIPFAEVAVSAAAGSVRCVRRHRILKSERLATPEMHRRP